jgi:hypothetical protein
MFTERTHFRRARLRRPKQIYDSFLTTFSTARIPDPFRLQARPNPIGSSTFERPHSPNPSLLRIWPDFILFLSYSRFP